MKRNRIAALVVLVVMGFGYPLGVIGFLANANLWNTTHALALSAGIVCVVAIQIFVTEWWDEEAE